MIKTIISLYIIIGSVWTVWAIHYYFNIDNTVKEFVKTMPENIGKAYKVVVVLIVSVITIAAWPIEVPASLPKAIKTIRGGE